MKRVSLTKIIVIFIFAFFYSSFLFVYPRIQENSIGSEGMIIWGLSIAGWIQLLFSLFTWKKLSGKIFSVYSIFLIFAYLFTFGQCLMWAFGIHVSNEIGNARLYTLSVPTQIDIIRTQLVTLIGLLAFHMGTVVVFDDQASARNRIDKVTSTPNSDQRNCLFHVCVFTSIISTPLMFYSIIRNNIINSVYGYGASLYNADVVASQNNIVLLLRMMYIPSLFGLLISSAYDKKVVKICYASFFIFTVLGLFAGDRGEWLFPLCLLIWMHHKYYAKITIRSFFKYAIGGFFLTVVAVAVRNSRGSGITISGIFDSIIGEKNPITSAVFELGGSMRPALIVLKYGWGTYPYGNSYLSAFLGMVTERVIMLFQPNYISLSGWFSKSFLGISYGAGFSFVAEAIINYGPYLAAITLLIIGMIFSRLIFSIENVNYIKSPLKSFFFISTAYSMIQAIRNTLLVATKTWFFSTILILLLYLIYSLFYKRRIKLA